MATQSSIKLQIALDVWSLEEAFRILNDVADYVDIIEAGTPLVVNEGMRLMHKIKEKYPNKTFVIDAKITDEFGIAKKAFAAGADVTTVLGILSDESVKAVIKEGKKAGKKVAVDLMNVTNKLQRAKEVVDFGADQVLVHCGIDEQKLGKTPLKELCYFKKSPNIKVGVAGGITLDTIDHYIKAGANIIIVGGALVKSRDRARIASEMKSHFLSHWKYSTKFSAACCFCQPAMWR